MVGVPVKWKRVEILISKDRNVVLKVFNYLKIWYANKLVNWITAVATGTSRPLVFKIFQQIREFISKEKFINFATHCTRFNFWICCSLFGLVYPDFSTWVSLRDHELIHFEFGVTTWSWNWGVASRWASRWNWALHNSAEEQFIKRLIWGRRKCK